MRSFISFIACVIFSVPLSATDTTRYELLDRLRDYLRNDLRLDIGDEFYTTWNESGTRLSYIYVSRPDTLAPPEGVDAFIYIGEDSLRADSVFFTYAIQNYHSLHYRTAGTSAAKLNAALWNYPEEAFVFIVIHEAVHVHLQRMHKKIPYEDEEALCDATADHFGPLFLRSISGEYKAALRQRKINENIYAKLNHAEDRFYKEKTKAEMLRARTEKDVQRQLKKANAFQVDRYNYPVNNAYLMRYHSYAHNYFFFRAQYLEYNSRPPDVIAPRCY